MDKILVNEIDNAMSEAIEWLSHIDCIIFQDDRPANEARVALLQRALNNLRGDNTMKIVETMAPKTRDGYAIQEHDLVWPISDPFTITSIVEIRSFFEEGEDEIEFTLWLDDGEDGGPFPASNHEVFKYQRGCLLAARCAAVEDIQCSQNSIEQTRGKIYTINKFLEELE